MYWKDDDLLNAAVSKMRNMVLITTDKKKYGEIQTIRFVSANRLTNLKSTNFLEAVGGQSIRIDLDVRESTPGSTTLRNHGTKFRMKTVDIPEIWGSVTEV